MQVADLAMAKVTRVANAQGGAHKSKVTEVLKPIVALSVGKKALKLRETTSDVRVRASHHTFQSENASINERI